MSCVLTLVDRLAHKTLSEAFFLAAWVPGSERAAPRFAFMACVVCESKGQGTEKEKERKRKRKGKKKEKEKEKQKRKERKAEKEKKKRKTEN